MIGAAIIVVALGCLVALLLHLAFSGTIDKNRDDTIDTP
jgi:hypothetical protein